MSMFFEQWSRDVDFHGDGTSDTAVVQIIGWPFNVDLSESPNFTLAAMEVTKAGVDELVGTFTVGVSANQIIIGSHGLTNGAKIRFALGTEPTNALPAPLTVGTWYYVVGARGNDFQVSLTSGGAAIDITTSGIGGTNEVWLQAGASETLTQIECTQSGTFATIKFPTPIPGGGIRTVRLRAKVFV